ncbi:hypothetical protein GGI11_006966, partial [Coemansia sp. RSA 2049]
MAIGLATATCIGVAIAAFAAWVFVLVLGRNGMFKGTAVERARAFVDDDLPAAVARWMERSAVARCVVGCAESVWQRLFGRRTAVFQTIAVGLYWAGLA